ncbi:MAG: helicase [Schumannella sp.]|nr:flp pilus-assembly TadE/G-like family protein [Microbacteriaceae bacterium]
MRLAEDAGAGSVLALALVGALVTCSSAVLVLGAALTVRQRAIGAADAAALAAADGASGAIAGEPCELAARVAAANRTALTGCQVDGLVATVQVSVRAGPAGATARSTAGPP